MSVDPSGIVGSRITIHINIEAVPLSGLSTVGDGIPKTGGFSLMPMVDTRVVSSADCTVRSDEDPFER